MVCEICLTEYDLNYSLLFADFIELFSNETNEENASHIIAISNATLNRNRVRETYVIYARNILARRRNEQLTYCGVGTIIIMVLDGTLLMIHQTICARRDTCQQNLELIGIATTIVCFVLVMFGILNSRHRPLMDIANLYN